MPKKESDDPLDMALRFSGTCDKDFLAYLRDERVIRASDDVEHIVKLHAISRMKILIFWLRRRGDNKKFLELMEHMTKDVIEKNPSFLDDSKSLDLSLSEVESGTSGYSADDTQTHLVSTVGSWFVSRLKNRPKFFGKKKLFSTVGFAVAYECKSFSDALVILENHYTPPENP